MPSGPATSGLALCLTDLHGGFGKKEILHGLSLRVHAGEIVTLIGSNGAGKSTLLKLVAGLISASQGEVELFGKIVTGLSVERRVQSGLSVLMQGAQVFPSLTVRENLILGIGIRPARDRSIAYEEVLEIFPALKPLLSYPAGLLSGGQRQCLALAMAIGQRPSVLLLDEPSAGLSPKLAHNILGTIRDLNQLFGIAVLLVEQRIHEALRLAHRAVVMVNGTIAAETNQPTLWLTEGALHPYFLGGTDISKSNRPEDGGAARIQL